MSLSLIVILRSCTRLRFWTRVCSGWTKSHAPIDWLGTRTVSVVSLSVRRISAGGTDCICVPRHVFHGRFWSFVVFLCTPRFSYALDIKCEIPQVSVFTLILIANSYIRQQRLRKHYTLACGTGLTYFYYCNCTTLYLTNILLLC